MKLFFEKNGKGKPLLVLHGVLGSSQNWRSVLVDFEKNFEIYRIDLRNHGQSPHDDGMNYELMSEDIIKLIKSENLEKVILLGHSLGGKLAMHLANFHPELIEKMIIVDISPFESDSEFRQHVDHMINLDLSLYESRREVDQALEHDVPLKEIRQFLLTNLMRDDSHKLSWKSNIKIIRDHAHELIASQDMREGIDINTLFIKGEFSDYINDQNWPEIKKRFPKSKLEIIPEAGHWPHSQNKEIFLKVLIDFLLS